MSVFTLCTLFCRAARPLLKRVTGPLGQPSMSFDVLDGLLLDDEGNAIKQVGWCG